MCSTLERIDADDHAADRVDRDLVVADDDEVHVARDRREHAPLARDDAVDDDELRLDDVLEVGDLPVERVVVIDEAMPVVLDPDVVLHREGDRRPRVRLELRAVDEEVGLRDRLGREDVIAQPPLVRERHLDLRHLVEAVPLRPGAREDRVVARLLEREARRDRDRAALADGELRHRRRLVLAIAQRAEHAFDDLGPRVRVLEELAGGDQVRLDERATVRPQVELVHRLADERADPGDVVVVAVEEEDAGVLGGMAAAAACAEDSRGKSQETAQIRAYRPGPMRSVVTVSGALSDASPTPLRRVGDERIRSCAG